MVDPGDGLRMEIPSGTSMPIRVSGSDFRNPIDDLGGFDDHD
jgi:hypothetical protein